jgi:hypothetical protein
MLAWPGECNWARAQGTCQCSDRLARHVGTRLSGRSDYRQTAEIRGCKVVGHKTQTELDDPPAEKFSRPPAGQQASMQWPCQGHLSMGRSLRLAMEQNRRSSAAVAEDDCPHLQTVVTVKLYSTALRLYSSVLLSSCSTTVCK